ncbi:MAG TPA: hypothetical protein PKH10_12720 [bacterium]|nr:hypothetical protein [bacterium]
MKRTGLWALALLTLLTACGEEKKEQAPLEIIGTYEDGFGYTHIVTETAWDQGDMGLFHITKYDNENDFLVAQNDTVKSYNPGKWSRMDWVWHAGALYVCQIAYDKDSAAAAEAETGADPTDIEKGCNENPWSELTVKTFTGAAGAAGSPAVAKDDPRIVAWATGIAAYEPGENLTEQWKDTANAIGPAEGNASAIVSLGEGGSITLTFESPITDGAGYDIAIFENSFVDDFLELAFVEVSSNGEDFVRFDATYLGAGPIGEYGTLAPSLIDGLAGKYRAGWGTPFDLATLAGNAAVTAGTIDLSAITHVRIVDIKGDGAMTDSHGHAIYDPYPTRESAGFDLDAVGQIN